MRIERDLNFRLVRRNEWSQLAWLAKASPGSTEIELMHGSQVETRGDWICEAAWAGPFAAGDFDKTDLITGSGVRLRGGTAVFVSSGSTVDRIVSCESGGHVYVSNSLPALAAVAGVRVDSLYERYYEDFRTIVSGIYDYKDLLATSDPPVRVTYFHNLVFDGQKLERVEKLNAGRELHSFASYRQFVEQALRDIGANMADPLRKLRYSPIGTLSTGYDSPAVAILAREMGNSEVLTFTRSRGGVGDDGSEIATRLGLTPIRLNREEWRSQPGCEIPFLAANAYGEEVHYTAAERYLTHRVLLTGYHGDKMWDTSKHDLSPAIKRGDPSGLSLCEWRLSAGFLHCPVAFFGVRNIDQIYRISTSEEMKPWSVGGDYDRPICRRIVEEAGVPRNLFGRTKSATSVVLWDREEGFLPPDTMMEYMRWLARNRMQWLGKGKLPPAWALRLHTLKSAATRAAGLSDSADNTADYLFRHLFPWALQTAVRRYMEAMPVAA